MPAAMGDTLSTPSQPNTTFSPPTAAAAAAATPAMSSTNSSQSKPTQSPESKTPIQETPDPPTDTKTAQIQENQAEKETLLEKDLDGDEGGEEEEAECGFCLFMKGGGCRDTFIEWEKCVEEAEKNKEDIVEKCFQATAALKKCMEVNSDYYAPILQAEKAAEAEAAKQLEEEKEKLNNQGGGRGESGEKGKEEASGGSDPKIQS